MWNISRRKLHLVKHLVQRNKRRAYGHKQGTKSIQVLCRVSWIMLWIALTRAWRIYQRLVRVPLFFFENFRPLESLQRRVKNLPTKVALFPFFLPMLWILQTFTPFKTLFLRPSGKQYLSVASKLLNHTKNEFNYSPIESLTGYNTTSEFWGRKKIRTINICMSFQKFTSRILMPL